MKTNVIFSMLLGATLVAGGCTSSSPQPVQVEQKTAGPGEKKDSNDPSQTQGPSVDTTIVSSGDGQAAIVLDERALKSAYAIDTSNMTYKFSFLTKTQDGAIKFDAAGKATLEFKDLPSETAGTVKLELLEAGVVKLSATQDNVTLKKGQSNNISLKLKAVDNGTTNPTTTDLSIDVTLDEQTTTTPPVVTNPPPVVTDPPPVVTNPPPTVDPIADWNGKEHKGNSKWSIISVN